MEFFHEEPFGWEAQCYTSGIVAATIANVNRDSKKKKEPFDALDFVPGAKRTPKQINSKDLKAKLQLAFAGAVHAKNNLQNNGGEGVRRPPKAIGSANSKARSQQRIKGGSKADSSRGKATSPTPQKKAP